MEARAGLYIHVPFCRRRCPFCDFAITTDIGRTGAWLAALEREMEMRAAAWPIAFDSVYLGGGTPSLLGAERVERVLAMARRSFALVPEAEVTLEANPGTLAQGDCERLLAAGVNRLSLGVQSLDDGALAFLGRDHTAADSLDTFARARREGVENISIDLIWGIPERSKASWEMDLRAAAALVADHVSAYQLTFEPGTPLARRRERGEVRELDEEEARDLFLATRDLLAAEGYAQYEVSSFARAPHRESRHNRKYWEGAPYLGVGPAAHSYRSGERSWNVRTTSAYVAALDAGRDPLAGRELLGAGERRLELLALAFRTALGLNLEKFSAETGEDLRRTSAARLRDLTDAGLLVLEGEMLRPTAAGMAVADALALEVAAPPAGGDAGGGARAPASGALSASGAVPSAVRSPA